MSSHRARSVMLAAAINLVWAASYPVSKRVLADYSYESLTFLRTALSGLFFVPVLFFSPAMRKPGVRRFRDAGWGDLAGFFAMGLVGCALATALQYAGTALSLASHIALITSLETAVLVVLSAVFLKERLGPAHVASLGLSLAGVFLITQGAAVEDSGSGGGVPRNVWLGNVLMVLAVICYALYTVFGKWLSRRWDPVRVTAIPFLLAAPVLGMLLVWRDPVGSRALFARFWVERRDWGAIFYLSAIATTLTFWLWNWLLARMKARDLGYSLLIQTAAGPVFSFVFGGETATLSYFGGASLVVVALVLALPKRAPSG